MAKLPLIHFALKSNKNDMYCVLCPNINQKGVLKFCGKVCAPNFETEIAQTLGYVHIKCVTNGKFLRRAPNQDGMSPMIVATADTTNEDKTDEGCTLFQLVNVEPNTSTTVKCRIVHVQSRLYIRPHNIKGEDAIIKGEDAILCAVSPYPDPSGVDFLIVGG